MKRTNQNISEDDLQAYVDGKLSSDQRKIVEKYLENNPEEEKRINAFIEQNDLIQTMYSKTNPEQLNRVKTNFKLLSVGQEHFFSSLSIAASVSWLVIGVFIGLIYSNISTIKVNAVTASFPLNAISAHVVYTPEVKHPVEVLADQEEHLVKWLSNRLKQKLKIPNLNPLGYALVGGRLLPTDGGPAAQFMYESEKGERLTLYIVAEDAKDTAFQYFEENKVKVFSWRDNNTGFAIVGSISKENLLNAATKIYDELII